jgi:pimeloyl-ACP methyl ester carboxylesterase/putative sterol carrier protein
LFARLPSGYICRKMGAKAPGPPSRGTEQVIRDRVRSLPRRFRHDSANGLVADWELRVGSQSFLISIQDHACRIQDGPGAAPTTTITTDPKTWLAIDEGRLNGGDAFFANKLGVQGNLDLAVRLQTLFRPFRRARRIADLDQVEIEAGGVRLSCYVVGRGEPVLLLHGLGASKITWLPILSALAEHHRVVVPDLPGHAESEKPVADYSPRFYARVMRHLLDRLEVERASVIGNSMGGRIGLELALRSPARVTSLILLDPAVPGLRWRYVLGFTRVVPTGLGAIPFPLRSRLMEVAIRRLFADPARVPEEAFSLAAQEFVRVYRDPRARMAFFASLRHIMIERPEPFFASLRRVKHPTLVIQGAEDRLVPQRLGIRLARLMPNATLVVLPGVGHVPQFEATKVTTKRILAFLEQEGRATKA